MTKRNLSSTQEAALAAFIAAFPDDCRSIEPFDPNESIQNLIDADLWTEAHHLNAYRAAWHRMSTAYHSALAQLDEDALSKLHVVTYTVLLWSNLFKGTPVPDRDRSISEQAADAEWHRHNS